MPKDNKPTEESPIRIPPIARPKTIAKEKFIIASLNNNTLSSFFVIPIL